jgi:Ca2+-transporting ATPase
LWRAPDGALTLAAKGAPEAILACCDLGEDARRGALAEAAGFAAGGVRVLGVAIAATEQPPADPRDATFRFLGFVGFVDPLRESAKDAVAEAHAAGIVVIMLTGDHPVTAAAIAGAAGLDGAASAMTGAALAALDEDALDAALRTCRVFARIAPEQKLRIVRALRRQGHVVAMTGDGVNDAPALKAAHIGIAMGRGGTDVAREAAGIVVLDDNFAAIVSGVRIGRRIFDNLRKVATYITAIHVPLGGLAIAPLLLGLPPMLAPAHIVLMEMAIDPTCSIAFESAQPDKDLMKRPPRALDEPILTPARLGKGLAQGGILLAACLALYAGLFSAGAGEETARAVAFLALTLGNVGLMLSNITNAPAWRLVGARGTQTVWLIAGAAVSVAVAGIYWPPAAQLLGFKSLSLLHFGLAWLTAAAAFALFEAFKLATGGILIQRNGRLKFPWEQEH